MSQKTVVNGFVHVHEERPFAPPHESPLERQAREEFGCTPKQVNDRVDRCENAAVLQLAAVLEVMRDVIPADTGETDEAIVDAAIARAFVRFGASGMFIQLAGLGGIRAGKEFGEGFKRIVLEELAKAFC
jgi:hypothetical protein